MTDSPLRAKGRAMRRNLMGAAYADKLDQQLYTDPIMEKFAALTQETVFGTLWTRPGLDLKTRTLICVVSDTATGRTPELKLHIRFACILRMRSHSSCRSPPEGRPTRSLAPLPRP
jgi:4-carboxymuconolactone decarboxylase